MQNSQMALFPGWSLAASVHRNKRQPLVADVCARRSRGNVQSQAAYKSIAAGTENLRREVLRYIGECGQRGATCYEVSEALGMRYTTASARISELKARGALVENGEKRPTCTGRNAAVLICQ